MKHAKALIVSYCKGYSHEGRAKHSGLLLARYWSQGWRRSQIRLGYGLRSGMPGRDWDGLSLSCHCLFEDNGRKEEQGEVVARIKAIMRKEGWKWPPYADSSRILEASSDIYKPRHRAFTALSLFAFKNLMDLDAMLQYHRRFHANSSHYSKTTSKSMLRCHLPNAANASELNPVHYTRHTVQ